MEIQDFEVWAELAKSDPEAFEHKRRETIDAFIASTPAEGQQRLRGLQFRVDMERSRASNPLSATIRISNMMWNSFAELRDALDRSVNGGLSESGAPGQPARMAEIIPLRRHH